MDTTERVVGMVLVRPAPVLGVQPFMADLAHGVEAAFAGRDTTLVMRIVTDPREETRVWQHWAEHRLVDAIVMVDLHDDDERLAAAQGLRLPVVLLGGNADSPLSSVFVDNAAGARAAAEALVELGHRRIARVGGPERLLHIQDRDRAFAQACWENGVGVVLRHGDFSQESGRQVVEELLRMPTRPTGIFLDNDLMAIGGIDAAREQGLTVPADVAIIAWDDTANARLASPPLSVVALDVHRLGVSLGEVVLAAMAGEPAPARHTIPAPTVRLAGST